MTSESAAGPGLFIAFEGGDGGGKSTQAALLARALSDAGHTVLRTREPGGTPVGEKLRSLVLDHGQGQIDARCEALIFAASRAAHTAQVIAPALARGEVVVCDRFIDSSIAYQGAGRGLGTAEVGRLNEWATAGLLPDLTVLLDVSPEAGRSRRTGRNGTTANGSAGNGADANGTGTIVAEDRMEAEPDAFHAEIRRTFLDLAAAHPDRYLVLDAGSPVDVIAAVILSRVQAMLPGRP